VPEYSEIGVAHVIQLAVAPVFLLSGIGAMLAVMTNRLGRIIDRARVMEEKLASATPEFAARLRADLAILSRRAKLISRDHALYHDSAARLHGHRHAIPERVTKFQRDSSSHDSVHRGNGNLLSWVAVVPAGDLSCYGEPSHRRSLRSNASCRRSHNDSAVILKKRRIRNYRFAAVANTASRSQIVLMTCVHFFFISPDR
jgi:uncharacterized protein DUF2721